MLPVGSDDGGKWNVPCNSRMARPDGVWSSWGRGFSAGEGVESGRGWRGTVGIAKGDVSLVEVVNYGFGGW
mgnify:CR=1 FL=1